MTNYRNLEGMDSFSTIDKSNGSPMPLCISHQISSGFRVSFESKLMNTSLEALIIIIIKRQWGGVYLGLWVCLPGLSRATCYSQRRWKVEAVADGNEEEEEEEEAGYGADGRCRCRWLLRWQGQPVLALRAVSFETVECKWLCWPYLDTITATTDDNDHRRRHNKKYT